eukprot:COSAG02_NODE_37210_length_445_cov_0.505780_1_plen_100_part_10
MLPRHLGTDSAVRSAASNFRTSGVVATQNTKLRSCHLSNVLPSWADQANRRGSVRYNAFLSHTTPTAMIEPSSSDETWVHRERIVLETIVRAEQRAVRSP